MTSAVHHFDRNIWTRILKFMEPEVLCLTLKSALGLDTFEKLAAAFGSNFALWVINEKFGEVYSSFTPNVKYNRIMDLFLYDEEDRKRKNKEEREERSYKLKPIAL